MSSFSLFMISRIRSVLLPHISRIFSAEPVSASIRATVFALCMACISFNIWMKLITPIEAASARMNVLSSPFSVEKHMQFGEILYAMGDTTGAEQELLIANQFFSVLGAQSPPVALHEQWNAESERLNNLYSYWGTIIQAKADYRDAYITLASLAQALHKDTEAQEYLHQALLLDPNLKP